MTSLSLFLAASPLVRGFGAQRRNLAENILQNIQVNETDGSTHTLHIALGVTEFLEKCFPGWVNILDVMKTNFMFAMCFLLHIVVRWGKLIPDKVHGHF